MPLRERLPVISPSAVPAPKYSGRQRFGSRRTPFWESESDQYWEKCKKNKRARRRKAVRLAVILAVIVLIVAAGCWGRSKSDTGTEDLAGTAREAEATDHGDGSDGDMVITTLEEAATIDRGVSDALRWKTRACVGSRTKQDLESKTCAKACAKARTTAPRPLAHRSCLSGCRAGVTTAWDAGCAGGRHRDCVKASTERCDFHCASYRNQFPKPTIFNQCLRSCLDVVEATCLKSKQIFTEAELSGKGGVVVK